MQFHGEPTPAGFPQYDQTTTPASPSAGEFWWDRNVHVLKRYDGAAWQWVGLDDLKNVNTTGKADADVLAWDDANSEWSDTAQSGGGGSAGRTLISEQILVSSAAQIDFTGIAGTYKALLIEMELRSDRAGAATDAVGVRVGNGSFDTGTNYEWSYDGWNGAHLGINNTGDSKFGLPAFATAATADTGALGVGRLHLPNYARTGYHRNSVADGGAPGDSAMFNFVGRWRNTAVAINQVRLYPINGTNFATGSSARLYGLV